MPVLTNSRRLMLGTQELSAVHRDEADWPVESGFDPSTITGLKIWLDAADYSPGSWPNRAVGGVATGFVGTPNPTVSINIKNGHPLVRFTVNEGRLRIPSGSGVHLDWTLVYVGRMVGPTPGRVVTAIYTPNNLLVGFWNGYQDVMYDNGFTVPNTQTAFTSDWKMYSGDGTTGLSRLFSDGTLLGSTTTAYGWGDTLSISGYSAGGTEETCDCEVAEVLQYNRKLSDAERAQVEDYLRVKWGL